MTAEGEDSIVSGTIDVSCKEGEKKALTLRPQLISDDISSLENDMIVWSYEGDLDCVSDLLTGSRNNEAVTALTTKKGSGVVIITAASRSDPNLSVKLTVRITEDVPTIPMMTMIPAAPAGLPATEGRAVPRARSHGSRRAGGRISQTRRIRRSGTVN